MIADFSINKSTEQIKKISKTVTVIMLVSLCSMLFFEPVHAVHHCNGDDCPVCLIISLIKNQLKTVIPSGLGEKVPAILHFLYISTAFSAVSPAGCSLIKQKVRLNN